MNFVKKVLSVVVFLLLAVCVTPDVFGQPGNPGGDPDKVPITGLEYLLVSGGILGGYKLFKKRPRKE
jgi:hypothetical protein